MLDSESLTNPSTRTTKSCAPTSLRFRLPIICDIMRSEKGKSMASGVSNKLAGQVGENLVSAVLGPLDYCASPYSGNMPGFDVTAAHPESLNSFPVQVKASTQRALVQSTIDKWCDHSIDEDNRQVIGPFKPLKHPNLIWVLVRLDDFGISGARFFICTERGIQKEDRRPVLGFHGEAWLSPSRRRCFSAGDS